MKSNSLAAKSRCSRVFVGGRARDHRRESAGVTYMTRFGRARCSMNATSVWREPLVQWLIKQHAGRPPERIIEDYVNARLRESSQSQLPVKVELITSLLGIKRRVADYPFAGRIYAEESGQLVMDLKAADSLPRQRFTC